MSLPSSIHGPVHTTDVSSIGVVTSSFHSCARSAQVRGPALSRAVRSAPSASSPLVSGDDGLPTGNRPSFAARPDPNEIGAAVWNAWVANDFTLGAFSAPPRIWNARRSPNPAINLGNSFSGPSLAARTKVMNSSGLRKAIACWSMNRKSCVVSCSSPGMSFLPGTPTSFSAKPRTSGALSGWRALLPFEKRA